MNNGKKYSVSDVPMGAFGYCIGDSRASFGMVVGSNNNRKRFLILEDEPASPVNIIYDIFVVEKYEIIVDETTYTMGYHPRRMSIVIFDDKLYFLLNKNGDAFTIVDISTGETKTIEFDSEVYFFTKWSVVDTTKPDWNTKFAFEIRPLINPL